MLLASQGLDMVICLCQKYTSEVVIIEVFCTIIGEERDCKGIQSKRQGGNLKKGKKIKGKPAFKSRKQRHKHQARYRVV